MSGAEAVGAAVAKKRPGRLTSRGPCVPVGAARDQTCVRSSTTFAILAMASSNGMPFSCEPSR